MRVLVLNAGSSSLKFTLTDTETSRHLLKGRVERIGEGATLVLGEERTPVPAKDHAEALAEVMKLFSAAEVEAIGHRVVHGGEISDSRLIDDELISEIERLVPLAPLHNPANLAGIRAARKAFPHLPQVAVFDTAFHQTMPESQKLYALPPELAAAGLRRYGFHGISHAYVSAEAAKVLNRPLKELKLVTLHLGAGASAAAVMGGKSVATSMGLTPLEGLVMASRPGNLDPGLVLELVRRLGLEKTNKLLNQGAGLKGLARSGDLRDIHAKIEAGDERARLALEIYVERIVFYVGGYAALMGGLDALVFTAGVGENDPMVRARVTRRLGLELDEEKNAAGGPVITQGYPAALVIPTDEELMIARETERVLQGAM